MLIWLKNVTFAKKLPINGGESFLEKIFDLNWKCKILLTQNRYIWNFYPTDQLEIYLWRLDNWVDQIQNIAKLKFEEEVAEWRRKICLFPQY